MTNLRPSYHHSPSSLRPNCDVVLINEHEIINFLVIVRSLSFAISRVGPLECVSEEWDWLRSPADNLGRALGANLFVSGCILAIRKTVSRWIWSSYLNWLTVIAIDIDCAAQWSNWSVLLNITSKLLTFAHICSNLVPICSDSNDFYPRTSTEQQYKSKRNSNSKSEPFWTLVLPSFSHTTAIRSTSR